MLFALIAIAELRAAQGRVERATSLASLVLHHRNSEKRDKVDAERLLATLSEQLTAEQLEGAVRHGRELQLTEVVKEILGPSPESSS